MKKLFSLLLALAFIVAFVGVSNATLEGRIRVTSIVLTQNTALTTAQFDPTKDVLVGYRMWGPTPIQIGIYDSTTVPDGISLTVSDEKEEDENYADKVGTGTATFPKLYPYPMAFNKGLAVIVDTSSATVDGTSAGSYLAGVTLYIVKDWNKWSE